MPSAARSTRIAVVLSVAFVIGGGVAVAATSDGQAPAPATAAVSTTPQTGYVSLTPCRIVSTAKAGGKIGAGKVRTFRAGGSGSFAGQGGRNGGCGVPVGASAIAVSVTALRETGNGYLTVYANGTARPAVTQVTYVKNQGTTTLVNAPLNRTTGKFNLYSSATSDVTVDVAGYFREPIAVTFAGDGTLRSTSSQVTGVTRESAGTYLVTFSQDVTNCAFAATTQGSNYNAAVTVYDPSHIRVFVRALDQSTTSTVYGDATVYLTATC